MTIHVRVDDGGDTELGELEKRLEGIYRQAEADARKMYQGKLERYESKLEEWKARVESGEVSQSAFESWKRSQVAYLTSRESIADMLAERAAHANEDAARMVSDELPRTFADSANRAAFEVDHAIGIDTNFTLYNQDAVRELAMHDPDLLPKVGTDYASDIAWNRQKFSSAITSGVLTGASVPRMTEYLKQVFDMNDNQATRAARTAFTSAQNAGRMHTYDRARSLGINMDDVWMATPDNRTRDSHRMLDGEVKKGETFSNGCRFPGDPHGEPGEVYNCRCRLAAIVEGFKRDYSNLDDRWSDLPPGTTYEQWMAGKEAVDAGPEAWAKAQERTTRGHSTTFVAEDIGTKPIRPKGSDYSNYEELEAARAAYREERAKYEARRDELVDSISMQPGHGYGTESDVRRWAERRGVVVSDELFEKVDARALDEAVDVLDGLFEKYPEVQRSYEAVGGKFGLQISDDRYIFMEANGGVSFNPRHFGSYREAVEFVVDGYTTPVYNERLDRWVTSLVRGDGTFRTTVTHEFGHSLDSAIRDGLSASERVAYEHELIELTEKYTTSDYSLTTPLEAFAEGFAEMECNQASEYATAFASFVVKWRR